LIALGNPGSGALVGTTAAAVLIGPWPLRSAADRQAPAAIDAARAASRRLSARPGRAALAVLSLFFAALSDLTTPSMVSVAWTADHGTIATATPCSPARPAGEIYGAGVPVASFETLQGAAARAALVGGTVVYFLHAAGRRLRRCLGTLAVDPPVSPPGRRCASHRLGLHLGCRRQFCLSFLHPWGKVGSSVRYSTSCGR
jgi:hypothetical protein